MQRLTAKIENYPLNQGEVESWEKLVDAHTSFDGYFAHDVTGRITTLEIHIPMSGNPSTLMSALYDAGACHLEFSCPCIT